MNFPHIKSYLDSTPHMLSLFSIGILLFSSLLCLEFRHSSHSGANEIIGYVTIKNKAIKRKADFTVVWDEVEEKQPLSRRDTIQSAALSNVLITLNDGTELKIDENSMVLLDFTENKINLDFKYGSIQTKRTGEGENSLVIHSDGVKVDVTNGDLNLNKKEKEDLNIVTTRGEATIQKGKDEVQLKENSLAIVNEKDTPKVQEMGIRLVSPEPSTIYFAKEKSKEVNFVWITKDAKSKIQISQYPNFNKLLLEEILDKPVYKKSLPIGDYYWRVTSITSIQNGQSEVRKISIQEEIPFRYKYPLPGSEYKLMDKPVFVSFSWDRVEGIQSYVLETSKSQTFSNIEKKFDILTTSFGGEFTEEGKYYFRIRTASNRPDFSNKTSDIGYFSLKKEDSITPPTLVNPKNGISLDETSQVLLGWKPDRVYDSFQVYLAENKEFTVNVRTVKTKENYSREENLKPKTYFWKVIGLGEDSNLLASSSVFSFQIKEKVIAPTLAESREIKEENVEEEQSYPPPILLEPEDKLVQEVKDNTQVIFHWKKQPQEIGYRFYLYKEKNFKEELVLKQEIVKNKLELNNPIFAEEGRFFWLVESKFKKGETFHYEKSKKREFKLIPKLLPPKIKKSEEVYFIHEK